MASSWLWGIDQGGTKIEGVVYSPSEDREVARCVRPTEAEKGYAHILSQANGVVEDLERELGVGRSTKVGLAHPGTTDPSTSWLKNSNTVVLNDQPYVSDLQEKLGTRVVAANDANCFALAEARLGAGRGAACVFGAIVGTGVGGGLVVHGRVLTGCHGIAGEWGHNVLEPAGEPCYCGRRGCIETVLSGPAIERRYERRSGVRRDLKDIVERGEARTDAHAYDTITELAENFGFALAWIVNTIDPDVIVVGGGVGHIDRLYTQGVYTLRRCVFNDQLATKVVRPLRGASAGRLGAALLTAPPEE
jgi:predicted NBD/HSP70 family sugar kinase